MVTFVAILSLVNIAIGYWLACFLQTGKLIPMLPTQSIDRAVPSNHSTDALGESHAKAAASERRTAEGGASGVSLQSPGAKPERPSQISPSLTPQLESRSPDGAALAHLESPAPSPLRATEDQSSTPPGASASPDEASSPGAEGPTSAEGAAVEENVLAGIEAFRVQLAAMKEKSSTAAIAE